MKSSSASDKLTTTAQDDKKSVGRPSKYDPKYCKMIEDFFTFPAFIMEEITRETERGGSTKITKEKKPVPAPPKFLVDFEQHIGVSNDTLMSWTEVHPDFRAAYARARDLVARHITTNALSGAYNPTFAQFALKNLAGWKDKSTVDTKLTGNVDVTIHDRFGAKPAKQVDTGEADKGKIAPDQGNKDAI